MSKPIAVVTGGAGFIGSHMVDLLLSEGYQVRAIDNLVCGRHENIEHNKSNSDFTFIEEDILNLQKNSEHFKGAELVFHFAGIGDIVPSLEKPSQYMNINVQGTVRTLEACDPSTVKRFVYAASSSCYGLAEHVPTNESDLIKPEYPYALSKLMGEQAAFHWYNVYKLPVSSVRIFNAYGTRSKTSGAYGAVMGVFLKQKLEGKPYTVVGDGEQKRDFLYVTDVANAFYHVGIKGKVGEYYNLGAGKPQSVNTLVKLLKGDVVHIPKRPGEPEVTWADINKIQSDTGWKPELSFEEGVQEILDNIDYWENAPLWDPDSIKEASKTWFEFLS